ncbi:hypothetical protein L2E82_45808 [Cichorium intybus]|uniref:Uncharacterized protein n=1 Tax=Cichorium intybus TaxID=13427 RepID=A0ACB8ZUJ0_CICIN|nr:hypothetical protein L2E82_45808 [Cichorium intybus]
MCLQQWGQCQREESVLLVSGIPLMSQKGQIGKMLLNAKVFLNSLEVTQIMKAEKLCVINQLPLEYIAINGKPLSDNEFSILQSCPNPPKKLKPGNYWYAIWSTLMCWSGERKRDRIMLSLIKFGAFSVFVTDGTPSPLKSHA